MKRVFILLCATIIIFGAQAQNRNVQSAYSYMNKKRLDKALEYITPALENEQSKEMSKTWKYAGDIYLQLMLTDNEKYINLDPDAAIHAYEAYMKCIELDTEQEYKHLILGNLPAISQIMYNHGVEDYNANNFLVASTNFYNSAIVKENLGIIDTLAYENALICAYRANEYNKSIEIASPLIEREIYTPNLFVYLAESYKSLEQMDNAVVVLNKAIEIYPEESTLRTTMVNIDLVNEDWAAVLPNITKAIELEPTNGQLLYVKGSCLQNLDRMEEAMVCYNQSLELATDPKAILDANYNIGTVYINSGITFQEEANSIPFEEDRDGSKYKTMTETADAEFTKAIPYLEKAYELDPTDEFTIRSLKEVYVRLKMQEKADALPETK